MVRVDGWHDALVQSVAEDLDGLVRLLERESPPYEDAVKARQLVAEAAVLL